MKSNYNESLESKCALTARVAKCLGWTNLNCTPRFDSRGFLFYEGIGVDPTGHKNDVPYYAGDLNIMHYTEMLLTQEQFSDYTMKLFQIMYEGVDYPPNRTVMCASAVQRAEAFAIIMEK